MYTLYTFAVQGMFFLVPHVARAHEVYVLEADTIAKDMSEPSLQVFSIILFDIIVTKKNPFSRT